MNQLLPLILDYQNKCQDNKTIKFGRNVKTDFKIFVHCWKKKKSLLFLRGVKGFFHLNKHPVGNVIRLEWISNQ